MRLRTKSMYADTCSDILCARRIDDGLGMAIKAACPRRRHVNGLVLDEDAKRFQPSGSKGRMRMSVHKEKEAAGPLIPGALFLIQGGIATGGAFAVCLRSKSQDKGSRLGRQTGPR